MFLRFSVGWRRSHMKGIQKPAYFEEYKKFQIEQVEQPKDLVGS